MKNNTSIKVPKKYQHMIEEICHDQDGWWIYLNRGFYVGDYGQHLMSFDTRKELESHIRDIEVCDCVLCVTGVGWN